MKKFLSIAFAAIVLAAMTVSCTKDLDSEPIDPNILTSNIVFDKPESYTYALAKLYASFSLSGQRGPSGLPDIEGIDEGFGNYLRQYWNAQELSTDEAVMAWNDQTIKDFHWQTWAPNDVFLAAIYSRIFFTISLSNELIRATAGKTEADMVRYNAEARFVRALAYYHALDLFGNPPFVTEADLPGTFYPPQTTATDLFSYIESELLAIENNLGAPRFEYGRADQAAAWTLLAKLYLNATTYIGVDKNTECIEYCNKVMGAGYQLALATENMPSGYLRNFSADNNLSPEIIFAINCDGQYTQSYGGMTYLVHAAVGGSMNPADFGIGSGWGGIRTTKALVYKFDPEAVKSPNPMLRFGHHNFLKNTNYDVIEVPGAHQGWDPATAPQLASVNGDGIYEGYVWFPEAANEFKFTQGGAWTNNWGDPEGDGTLVADAGNIIAGEAGYYRLVVDLNALTYTMTLTDWGVIGSATEGGWDSDQNMTYDATTGLWSATLRLSAGEIKFRANDGWDLNYGDDGADGILEAGGANIAISSGGTYVISMKLGTPDYTYFIEMASTDGRALFWTDGQSLEINDIGQFTEGWAITKFRNVNADGSEAIHPHADFVCTDYPMFRLADIYLMYAEAVLRGGSGGDRGTALDLINQIRERAYGNNTGNINDADLTLDFILDERARELYWEGHRRTDLIRFGQFTNGTYVWPWKGKTYDGTQVPAYRNLYPIPSADMNSNPNLKQNLGY